MISSRSSNGANALFIAFVVSHSISSRPIPTPIPDALHGIHDRQ
jgi:hypothetical protein